MTKTVNPLKYSKKDIIERVILSIIIVILIFSTGSFIPAIPVFLLVPVFSAFLITFLFEDRKLSSIIAILLCGIGSLLFSYPPKITAGITPDTITLNLIADRQAEMLRFSPPLLIGILGGALGWGMATLLKSKEKLLKYAVWILFVLLCINFVWISMDLNPTSVHKASEEPLEGKYNNFNSMNLKTFYLMKKGIGFYQAYSRAYSSRAETMGQNPGDAWNWRQPALYFIWNWVLPTDGFYILYLYLLLCVFTMYFAMDIARFYVEPPLNLLAPALLAPLFVYGVVGFWFTFPEYWGLFFLMMGLWGIHRKNKVVAMIGLTVAPLIRSFYILSWLGIVIPSLFTKDKKEMLHLLAPGILFPIDFLIHYRMIMGLEGAQVPPVSEWFRGSLMHFLHTLHFGFALISRSEFVLPFMFILFIISIILLRKNYTGRIILGCALLPMILFLVLGAESYRSYWGIIYLPFFLLAISLIPYKLKIPEPDVLTDGKS